ncbi:Gfo/Idh/MocA family protein [Reichenbachiella ulvae]|uniref:Gfo/Idh/MocA family oxidoreductase n=1 Tax=Reichenbachiella ulvae TaxID=2980104 RepID=A0ABT3CPD6_9BACT|nr:Gfo/Idh/MocA family oxidoreductase [Reichenbachiella ulvae]MCV9385499.1 Gfo/Idh/MocA family oxidoreductase [Reichenbachiella ulvae]
MKVFRWGIIGCGDVTEVKSGPAYQKVEGFELVAVMRRDFEKAQDYAKRHGVPRAYGDADELIADKEVDAVYIATPPDSHEYYALKVAAAGKPCCIEKPMAPDYASCERIVQAFAEKQLPLFTAYYRRTLPRFVQVKKWIDKGEIGELRHVRWHYSTGPNKKDLKGLPNWRTEAEIAPGGYFDDLASHGLDLFNYLLGDIVDVQGISLNQQGLYTAKDAFTACWTHPGGVTGSGSWNFGSGVHEDVVELYGSKGKIAFAIFDEQPVSLITDDTEEQLKVPHPATIQQPHVQAMYNDLTGQSTHPSTGKTGAHASWVMDKILGKL